MMGTYSFPAGVSAERDSLVIRYQKRLDAGGLDPSDRIAVLCNGLADLSAVLLAIGQLEHPAIPIMISKNNPALFDQLRHWYRIMALNKLIFVGPNHVDHAAMEEVRQCIQFCRQRRIQILRIPSTQGNSDLTSQIIEEWSPPRHLTKNPKTTMALLYERQLDLTIRLKV